MIVTVLADGGWKYLSTGAWTDDIDEVVERAKNDHLLLRSGRRPLEDDARSLARRAHVRLPRRGAVERVQLGDRIAAVLAGDGADTASASYARTVTVADCRTPPRSRIDRASAPRWRRRPMSAMTLDGAGPTCGVIGCRRTMLDGSRTERRLAPVAHAEVDEHGAATVARRGGASLAAAGPPRPVRLAASTVMRRRSIRSPHPARHRGREPSERASTSSPRR